MCDEHNKIVYIYILSRTAVIDHEIKPNDGVDVHFRAPLGGLEKNGQLEKKKEMRMVPLYICWSEEKTKHIF